MNTKANAAGLSILLVVLAFFCVDALAADTTAEVAAIHAVDQAWLKAYNGGDADAVAGLYAEKAVLLPPGAPAPHGRAAIRAFFVADLAASKKAGMMFHLGPNPDGGAKGDMGWASGTYSVTDASGKVVDSGKYLSVSEKQDGKWFYLRDTWNSDIATSAEASPAKKE